MGRPYVTAKTATTLDGRIAAADGTSQWITGPEARAHAHEVRARVGAIIVGTGTVLQDDPALSARPPAPATPTPGETRAPRPPQPLRVVMGLRPIPPQARVRSDPHLLRHFATHNPGEVLDALHEEQIRHVLIEGGASILGAFLQAGLVDELHAYITPMFLGAGRLAVPDLAIPTLTDAPRWTLREVQPLGDSLWLRATRPTPPPPSEPTLPEPTRPKPTHLKPTHPEPANP
jgi:diaminohydroxyphosphoribosylaminopyrimidine deaminase/5-amino-6-(5-phosphoribosylamino)uracil reductase